MQLVVFLRLFTQNKLYCVCVQCITSTFANKNKVFENFSILQTDTMKIILGLQQKHTFAVSV